MIKEKEVAKRFKAARKQHSNEAAEDYTELVADLIQAKGEARTGQIAEHLGISHVTALRTIRRLQNEGYLVTSPHKPVELTTKGRKTAKFAKERHRLLVDFLVKIGVPATIAEQDVEGAEHTHQPDHLRMYPQAYPKFKLGKNSFKEKSAT